LQAKESWRTVTSDLTSKAGCPSRRLENILRCVP
jgi:hypothetical protein